MEAWQTWTQAHQLVQGWASARRLHRRATLGTRFAWADLAALPLITGPGPPPRCVNRDDSAGRPGLPPVHNEFLLSQQPWSGQFAPVASTQQTSTFSLVQVVLPTGHKGRLHVHASPLLALTKGCCSKGASSKLRFSACRLVISSMHVQ